MSLSPNQYQDVSSETTHHVSYTWISVLLPVVNSAAQQGDTHRDSSMELTETTFKHTQDCESSRMNWEKSSVQLLSETKESFTAGPDPNERDNNSCISYSSDLNLTGMTFHWRIIYLRLQQHLLIRAVYRHDLWACARQWAHCLTSGIWHPEWLLRWWSGPALGWKMEMDPGEETSVCTRLLLVTFGENQQMQQDVNFASEERRWTGSEGREVVF